MPRSIIAGNWKMNTTLAEAMVLAAQMRDALDAVEGVEKVICPPFISLMAVKGLLDGTSIRLGAQNMHFEEKGAYTGEVSPTMLAGLCQYIILGHSERRQYFFESDDQVNRKLLAALQTGLSPILCVGEHLEQRESGRAEEVVDEQLRSGLEGAASIDSLTVAYEPVWAIGTGVTSSGKVVEQIMASIRLTLTSLYGSVAQEVPLLYGGSVTPDNITEFSQQPNVNGALVGGASLDALRFVEIARQLGEREK